MRSLAALAAIALLTITGCADTASPANDSPAPAAAEPSPTQSPTPAAKKEYDGAQRLVGGLNEAGIACLNWERTENPIGADERGSCYVGEEELVVSIYASHDEAAAHPKEKAALLAGISDVYTIVGGNWTVSCDTRDLCALIEGQFGGELMEIPA